MWGGGGKAGGREWWVKRGGGDCGMGEGGKKGLGW